MKHRGLPLSANISIMFTEHPYLARFAAARDAGFDSVETWWPFGGPQPSSSEVEAWVTATHDSELRVDAINFYAGDMPAGERGVCALPARHDELRASFPVLQRLAEATGCSKFNLLYGRPTSPDHGEHAAVAYREAAKAVHGCGGLVLIEPLATGLNGTYPLLTTEDVQAFVAAHLADLDNVALLLDTFHLSMNGVDPATAFDSEVQVGHIQLADSPGRGEPGSGTLDWDRFFDATHGAGYDGTVGCEYRPTTTTADSLLWVRS